MSNLPKPIGAPPIWDTSSPTTWIGHFRSNGHSDNGQWLTAVFTQPNVDTVFTIALGYVPGGYNQYACNVPGTVYNGTVSAAGLVAGTNATDWTPNSITLRADTIGTYRLWIS